MFNKDEFKYFLQNVDFIFKCLRCYNPFIDTMHHPSEWKKHFCKVCIENIEKEKVYLDTTWYETTRMGYLGNRTEPWELMTLPLCHDSAKDSIAGGLRTKDVLYGAWNNPFNLTSISIGASKSHQEPAIAGDVLVLLNKFSTFMETKEYKDAFNF